MTEPINIKMKLADADEVDRVMTAAVQKSGWLVDHGDAVVADIVCRLRKGLGQAGCLIFQVDNAEAGGEADALRGSPQR